MELAHTNAEQRRRQYEINRRSPGPNTPPPLAEAHREGLIRAALAYAEACYQLQEASAEYILAIEQSPPPPQTAPDYEAAALEATAAAKKPAAKRAPRKKKDAKG